MKNNKVIVFLIVIAIASSITAQTPEPASVEGSVALSGTTDPVPSAVVSLVAPSGDERRTTTGPDGKFALRALPAGRYRITTSKPGFFPLPGFAGQVEVNLTTGQRLTGIALQVVKGGVLTGRLTDESRNPRSNMRVDVMRYRYVNGQRTLSVISNTTTDDRGDYRVSGLEPAEYLIRAAAMMDRSQLIAPTFYPGVGDVKSAVSVSVKAGTEYGGLNFSLSSGVTHTIQLRVVVPADFSARRATVSLNTKNPAEIPIATSSQPDANDIYVFEKVQQGSYIVSAQVSEGIDNSELNRVLYGIASVVVADEDVDVGALALVPGVQVAGRVVTAASTPLNLPLRVSLTVVEGSVRGTPAPIWINEDGTFRFSNVPKGSYRVSVVGLPGTLFLESVRYAARTAPDLTLSVDADIALELRINGPSGIVQGTVRNASGAPAPNAQIVLIPSIQRRSNQQLFRVGASDQNGVFTIRGVTPDEYRAFALEKLEAGEYQDPEFVAGFENRAVTVGVRSGSVSDLNLRVISR